jgi:tRNA threonylcarbamoyladenosine biosynthesis protein TsaB
MYILSIRSDKPEAEIGLFDNEAKVAYLSWEAHRALADTIHLKIKELLDSKDLKLSDLGGIVVFQGPGSFTGLRIGISVANTLAYSLNIPVVSAMSEDWINLAIKRLVNGENEKIVTPEYGALPHITQQKK